MVIAVSPYGVLEPITKIGVRPEKLLWTGPRHHLAYFCHRREDGVSPLVKLDPWRAIRLAKEDCLGPGTHAVDGVIRYPPQYLRSGADLLQHCLENRRLDR